jgi:hypothetical protein
MQSFFVSALRALKFTAARQLDKKREPYSIPMPAFFNVNRVKPSL